MSLPVCLVVSAIVTMIVVVHRLRRRDAGVGLVLATLANLWAIHGLGAALYVLPWFRTGEYRVVEAGFQLVTWGIVSFSLGCTVVTPLLMRASQWSRSSAVVHEPAPELAKLYMLVGLLCYLVLLPIAKEVPTVTALIATGWKLVIVGFGLLLWQTWTHKKTWAFLGWFLACFVGLPLMTIISHGFLGHGSSAVLAIFIFVASFVRPRWKVLLAGLLLGYLGLSFYVTYMRDRADIREAVWHGQSFGNRIEQTMQISKSFEWFNLFDQNHLKRVDERLNQTFLIGAAEEYLGAGMAQYAGGETVWEAFLALVPRALWPSKPVYAGSGDLVSRYTGIMFDAETSVGIGQVMEFYVNFRTVGVIVGFLVVGVLLGIVDEAAAQRLEAGDWQGFAYWYLPGLSFIDSGGSLVEATSSAGAGIVTAFLVNRYLLRRLRGRSFRRVSRTTRPPSASGPSRL